MHINGKAFRTIWFDDKDQAVKIIDQTILPHKFEIKNLNTFIKEQENCIFSRLTGSGSTCVGYFKNLKSARKAKKNITKKFPNYWCEKAETI